MSRWIARVLVLSVCIPAGLVVSAARIVAQGTATTGPNTRIEIGRSVVALHGPWKFAVGDSPLDPVSHTPVRAAERFDDSAWEEVDLRPDAGAVDPTGGQAAYVPGWTAKGHSGYSGYAWYRVHVKFGAYPGAGIALLGPNDIDDVYQVYFDGALLGGFGDFASERPRTFNAQPAMFALPDIAGVDKDQSHVIAFRVWMDHDTLLDTPDAGGMHTAPLLGELGVVTALYRNNWFDLLRAVVLSPVETAIFLLLSIGCVSLIWFDRTDRVYLWMGAALFMNGFYGVIVEIGALTQWISIPTERVFADVIYAPLTGVLWVMVWRRWFGFRRPVWLPIVLASLGGLLAAAQLFSLNLYISAITQPLGPVLLDLSIAIRVTFFLIALAIVIFAIRLRGAEGWFVLVPVLLSGVTRFEPELAGLGLRVGWFPFGISIDLALVTECCVAGVLALLLLRRVYRNVIRQRRMAGDIQQAQEVQQVMLTDARMSFGPFAVECEYRPAQEVGGDFFQILPHASDGSLLVVAGDVTGKGLKAGMIVALLVGAIRTAAEVDNDPLYILNVLNNRLIGRGDSYATCLVLRIEADGSAMLANAGHLPPYRNDAAIEIEGSLPLGMIAGIAFSSMRFQVDEGDRLTMISDGIIEAADAHGNLFGFERTRELVAGISSADQLASAAQAFGQDDDISVICITRVAELDGMLV